MDHNVLLKKMEKIITSAIKLWDEFCIKKSIFTCILC